MLPQVASVLGPTAAGKTALAVALRQAGLPVEVVCCDGPQMVRGVDAATAKPTAAERAAVPHHLVDVWPLDLALSAGHYVTLATAAIAEIHARGGWPLLVGGTGLYHRALCRGLAPIPEVPATLRAALGAEAHVRGLQALWEELARVDPDYAANTPPNNRQRVLRALEVWRHTGQSFSAWHGQPTTPHVRSFDIVLQPARQAWEARLARRAFAMVEPLLVEAACLRDAGVEVDAPGLAALGYRDAYAVLAAAGGSVAHVATTERDALADALLRSHRRYAKRQRTFFASLVSPLVLDPEAADCVDLAAAALRRLFAA